MENIHSCSDFQKVKRNTVGFFFLTQPERKVLNSNTETKHYKDFLWIMTIKTPLRTDDFVNLSLGVETPFDTSKNQKNQMESTKIKKIKRNKIFF